MFDFLNLIPFIGGFLATVVPFVIVLSIVVTIHELGHYLVGRWCGIHAEVFSLGFGPILTTLTDKRGTRWQIAAIPLGGYVKFLGDTDAASRPDSAPLDPAIAHKTLTGAALYKRALTVVAGPVANFLLSIVLFAGLAMIIGKVSNEPIVGELQNIPLIQHELQTGDKIIKVNGQDVSNFGDIERVSVKIERATHVRYVVERDGETLDVSGPYLLPPLVGAVIPVSPASKAGLKEGDFIIAIDDQKLSTFQELSQAIKKSDVKQRNLTLWRDGHEILIQISPAVRDFPLPDGTFEKRVMVGIAAGYAFTSPMQSIGPIDALKFGVLRTYHVIVDSLNGIYQIATGVVGAENLQGPLGIAQMSGDTASNGILSLLTLVAFISTAIGFLNLLPIPVLDGGHLVLYAFEALTGRAPSPKFIQVAMTMGMSLLLGLMLFATFNDISRMIWG
ncbi:MAG: RIP metalloprotease RseP [Rhodobacteraceae bacterium]|nr:MAG: RIP metalloprotease RseP [Paracoccaceae bacterium]